MMRVLYFHQHFGTPSGSTGIRSYEFSRRLVECGHEVLMVCGTSQRSSLAEAADSTRRKYYVNVDGIDVLALPLHYSNHDGLFKRAVTFLRFAWRSIRIALTEDYDLLFATSTPLTAGIPGIVARWLRGKPFVFEVRDLWPELPRALGMRNPLLLGGMSLLEWVTYHSAHACIGLSPGIVQGIRRRGPADLPVAMIPNASDVELFQPGCGTELTLPGIDPSDFLAVFAGAHGKANGLDSVLDAAAELARRGNHQIKFVFIGDGKEKPELVARAEREKLPNCLFLPPIPKNELATSLACFDVGLMILKNIPAFYFGTSPNKFFDYIAAGIPVLNNYPGWLAELITEHDCGVAVAPDDPGVFADALEFLASQQGECKRKGSNARRLAEDKFSRAQMAEEFVSFLEEQWHVISERTA